MSVTTKDAIAINTVLHALFDLPGAVVGGRHAESRIREAAEHLASRAVGQLGGGVRPDQVSEAPLKVKP